MKRIGIFGGTFNPIHSGHIGVALKAAAECRLDRVLVVPAACNPFKEGCGADALRWTLVKSACAPYEVLEPVIDKLNTKYWYSTVRVADSKEYKEIIEVAIAKAKIPIRAELGRSTISVNDFVNIQKGDIIKLNTKTSDELNVYIGNIRKFLALPGSASDSYAVKISQVIKEEE